MAEETRHKAPHDLHDRGFKELFQNQDAFLDLLQHFIADPWVWRVGQEAKPFQLSSNEFVTEDFAKLQSDIVYQLHFAEAQQNLDSEDFFVLLEFQSSVDSRMVVRLYHYIYEIQRQAFKSGKTRSEVPLVLPIVLYDGRERWTAPMHLHELTGQAIRPMISSGVEAIDLGYYFLDVKRYSINELLAMKSPVACVLVLDGANDWKDLHDRLNAAADILEALEEGRFSWVTTWIDHVIAPSLSSEHQSEVQAILNKAHPKVAREMVANLGRVFDEELEKKAKEGEL
ncbi:MAG: Rpn family recombination-promoting nuclease/putative transposase, partial [Bacillota bacterium]|nr:Rpn family recombination-promoting nuclease/putative transposase [Bacillota bacterium]